MSRKAPVHKLSNSPNFHQMCIILYNIQIMLFFNSIFEKISYSTNLDPQLLYFDQEDNRPSLNGCKFCET